MSARKPTGRLVGLVMWLVISASFGLSAQTWIEIARMTGFDQSTTAPLLAVTLRLAWLMPMVVDGYVVVALLLWMSNVSEEIAGFARKNTYAAAGFGVVAQSVFHAAMIASTGGHRWWAVPLSAVVGAIPPGFAALAVHMRVLVARHSATVDPRITGPVTDPVRPSADPGHPAPVPSTTSAPAGGESSQVTPDSDPGSPLSGNAALVRRAHEAHPTASRAQLARLTGLSPSTVKRYRPPVTRVNDPDRVTGDWRGEPITVTRINGSEVPALAGPEMTG